jgi:hypothetical protein
MILPILIAVILILIILIVYKAFSLCLTDQLLRQIASKHVFWTYLYIIYSFNNLNDKASVGDKLLQNAKAFEKFGLPLSKLQEHISLIVKMIDDNAAKVPSDTIRKLRDNADSIIEYIYTTTAAEKRKCGDLRGFRDYIDVLIEDVSAKRITKFDKAYKYMLNFADTLSLYIQLH